MEQPLDASANGLSAVLASFVTGAFGVFIWLMTRGSESKKNRNAERAEVVESERKARVDLWDSMKELYEQLQERNDKQVSTIAALETERSLLHDRILKLERSVYDLNQQSEQCQRDNVKLQQQLDNLSKRIVT